MPLQEFAPVTLYVQNILAKNAFSKLTPDPSCFGSCWQR